ncbi:MULTISPECIES: hypothetical protein [unclassified Bradyrhizobium]|uniref:hypothetical protein n=1 Tax=unclassified Bradyrhizobium TaxID=2631580 RepID=UPI001FFA84DE|nr:MULTISPECIES: hypothetical protein [unclassified Bradyrhizobium]MCK1347742.1 hypothetical protein [Bradyrhizobium sp. CW11]MCK1707500.1 hypothetical protein [Bradyrhizobium sp. 146]
MTESLEHQIIEAGAEELGARDLHGHESPDHKWRNRVRILGILCLALAAAYGVYDHMSGNTVFGFVGIICLVITATWDKAGEKIKSFAGILVSSSTADVVGSIARWTRHFFRHGDYIVRGILLFLAFGATAFICKYFIGNFNLLPPYLDLAVKRLGPSLAIVSLVLYPASLVSKRIFELSAYNFDQVVRRYEFAFYASVALFSITVIALFAGVEIEGSDKLPVHSGGTLTKGPTWPDDTKWLFVKIAVIWLIWVIATGACIISRFFEWSWRDRPTMLRGQRVKHRVV